LDDELEGFTFVVKLGGSAGSRSRPVSQSDDRGNIVSPLGSVGGGETDLAGGGVKIVSSGSMVTTRRRRDRTFTKL